MSAYVSSNGFPIVLEFPDDSPDSVAERFAQLMSDGGVVNLSVRTSNGQDSGSRVLLNFGTVSTMLVGTIDPDTDDDGNRTDDARMLFTASLGQLTR